MQPGPSISPLPVGVRPGYGQGLGRFLDGKAGEDPELGHLGGSGILAGQDRQRLVDVQDGVRVGLEIGSAWDRSIRFRLPPCFSVFLRRALSTRMRRMASAAAAIK